MLLIPTIACDVFAHDNVVMLCCGGARVVRVMSMCAWTEDGVHGHTHMMVAHAFCPSRTFAHVAFSLTHAAFPVTRVACSLHAHCIFRSRMLHFSYLLECNRSKSPEEKDHPIVLEVALGWAHGRFRLQSDPLKDHSRVLEVTFWVGPS